MIKTWLRLVKVSFFLLSMNSEPYSLKKYFRLLRTGILVWVINLQISKTFEMKYVVLFFRMDNSLTDTFRRDGEQYVSCGFLKAPNNWIKQPTMEKQIINFVLQGTAIWQYDRADPKHLRRRTVLYRRIVKSITGCS